MSKKKFPFRPNQLVGVIVTEYGHITSFSIGMVKDTDRRGEFTVMHSHGVDTIRKKPLDDGMTYLKHPDVVSPQGMHRNVAVYEIAGIK